LKIRAKKSVKMERPQILLREMPHNGTYPLLRATCESAGAPRDPNSPPIFYTMVSGRRVPIYFHNSFNKPVPDGVQVVVTAIRLGKAFGPHKALIRGSQPRYFAGKCMTIVTNGNEIDTTALMAFRSERNFGKFTGLVVDAAMGGGTGTVFFMAEQLARPAQQPRQPL
jgi:hypothetical protein